MAAPAGLLAGGGASSPSGASGEVSGAATAVVLAVAGSDGDCMISSASGVSRLPASGASSVETGDTDTIPAVEGVAPRARGGG